MIEKAKNILLESSSFGRRSFMKLAGLTSLITVLPTFRTREAHARYILNRNWWKSREIYSTAEAVNKTVEYCSSTISGRRAAQSGRTWIICGGSLKFVNCPMSL